MKNVKKYKLVNGNGYSHFIKGEAYNEDVVLGTRGVSVKELVKEYPNDWEEVVEQEVKNVKKYKFLGDFKTIYDGIYGGLIVGNIYNLDDEVPESECGNEVYDLVKYYVETYPNDWEEVTEELINTPKIFTDAEVVTLVTFLNDNFKEFEKFLKSDPSEGGLFSSHYSLLRGNGNEADLLIDKLEKNDINLTEAEKVTIITFLNDNFEDFRNFVEWTGSENLAWEFYNSLTHDTMNGEQASLLIDKIELS